MGQIKIKLPEICQFQESQVLATLLPSTGWLQELGNQVNSVFFFILNLPTRTEFGNYWPRQLACAMRSLATIITIVQSSFLFSLFFSLSVFCFSPTSEKLPCVKNRFPQYFGITRRYMQKKLRKKSRFFCRFFSLYGQHSVTAASATRSPWSI